MNQPLPLLLWFLCGILLLCLAGCAGSARWLAAGDTEAFDSMMADARQAQVIFVGEFHDQRPHHDLQLRVINSLQREGEHLAIGLEMFDMESQPVLDRWVRGEMALQDFVVYYHQRWSINWAEYDSILLLGRNRHVPLVALNAPSEIVSRVSHGGFDHLEAEDIRRLPEGVTGAISPSYREFLRYAFAGHTMSDATFNSFCEAQGVRNNTMESLIRRYLSNNPGSRMVVITGVGHALRRAIADDLASAGITARVIIPVVEGLFDRIDPEDADYLVYP